MLAIIVGAAVGLAFPAVSDPLAFLITPVIGVLLYVTFLSVPFTSIRLGFRSPRFLAALMVVNFVIAPIIAFALSRFAADDPALLFGVLLVLLTPCIDYVIVFARLGGADSARLTAATPLLMLTQMLLLPVYLAIMVGPTSLGSIEPAPFVQAFVFLIALPLAAAALTQLAGSRSSIVKAATSRALAAMVPLMMLTLSIVVASQVHAVGANLPALLRAVPIYIAFLAVMPLLGALLSRVARLDVASARAVTFSGATRNSLVVLPLALALPASLSFAALVVVTQTLVELIGMVLYIKLIPRLLPPRLG